MSSNMPPQPQYISGVKATLHSEDLWRKFDELGTEMIITKSGRRMFPSIQVTLEGLEPESRYFIVMDMELAVDARMKFSGSTWSFSGRSEEYLPSASRLYIHPDSPSTGRKWMSHFVSMQKAKLTNNTMKTDGNIVLTSMHKYQPRIHIIKATEGLRMDWTPMATFVFPETQFIGVTAYQNELITKLKIENNPFAKGFREKELKDRSKRKAAIKEEQSERPLKRASSVQSSSSYDSGHSSFGSMSPAAEDLSLAHDHVVTYSSPRDCVLESPISVPPQFPWDHFAMTRSLLGYPSFDFLYPYRLWRYPYLVPTPPSPHLPFPFPFTPMPYHLPALVPPPSTMEQQHLIDLSFHKH